MANVDNANVNISSDKMSQSIDSAVELKISRRSFLTSLIILFAVVLLVGVLTYVIQPGQFSYDSNGQLIAGTWTPIDASDTNRVPVYRWLTLPFEALIFSSDNFTIIQVCIMLVALGGSFFIIEGSGGMKAMIIQLVSKFSKRKYAGLWVIFLAIAVLSSVYGLQEQLLVLFPIMLGLCLAMNWDNMIAISLILISSAVGFTVSISNPFTLGTSSIIMGTNVMDGVWYRVILLVVFSALAGMYLHYLARKTEKRRIAEGLDGQMLGKDMLATPESKRVATMYTWLFVSVLVIMLVASSIDVLSSYTMLMMSGAFIIGTFTLGSIVNKSFRATGKQFVKGAIALSPGILLLMLAYSAKYLAEQAMIMDTILNSLFGMLEGKNVFVVIILIYFSILILEFFVASGSSKALIIMPILAAMPLETMGLSKPLVILIFMFADGFTNIFFPTCATLVIGLSLAKVSFAEWYKKTWAFQLIMLALSLGALFVAQIIGY